MNVKAKKPLNHGDLKAVLVFPERWPTIPEGTILQVIHCYGHWIKVRGPNGSSYYVEDYNVEEYKE